MGEIRYSAEVNQYVVPIQGVFHFINPENIWEDGGRVFARRGDHLIEVPGPLPSREEERLEGVGGVTAAMEAQAPQSPPDVSPDPPATREPRARRSPKKTPSLPKKRGRPPKV